MPQFQFFRTAALFALAMPLAGAQAPTQSCSIVNGIASGNCAENGNERAATTHLEVRGPVVVAKIAPSATVHGGGVLIVQGQVTGNVAVERGGSLTVNGQVAGTIICRGGSVTVRGQAAAISADSACTVAVHGQVQSLQARGAKVFVNAGAVVNGKPSEKAVNY